MSSNYATPEPLHVLFGSGSELCLGSALHPKGVASNSSTENGGHYLERAACTSARISDSRCIHGGISKPETNQHVSDNVHPRNNHLHEKVLYPSRKKAHLLNPQALDSELGAPNRPEPEIETPQPQPLTSKLQTSTPQPLSLAILVETACSSVICTASSRVGANISLGDHKHVRFRGLDLGLAWVLQTNHGRG